jgi:hypothetical protein
MTDRWACLSKHALKGAGMAPLAGHAVFFFPWMSAPEMSPHCGLLSVVAMDLVAFSDSSWQPCVLFHIHQSACFF